MPEFLELLPPAEALALLFEPPARGCSRRTEWVDAGQEALGRVTARADPGTGECCRLSRAAPWMAMRCARGIPLAPSDSLPAYLALCGEVPMGAAPDFVLGAGQAAADPHRRDAAGRRGRGGDAREYPGCAPGGDRSAARGRAGRKRAAWRGGCAAWGRRCSRPGRACARRRSAG